MKVSILLISMILFGCSGPTDQPPECPHLDKLLPLHLELKILETSDTKISLLYKLRNDSSDIAILYKPLLPMNNRLEENIFSIFDTVDYLILRPKFQSKEDFCLPQLKKDNFVFLRPHDSLVSIINLCDYYDFSEAKQKGIKYFMLAPTARLPLVDETLHQVTAWDTSYLQDNPIYFWVELPQKPEVDSMRVQFTIP